MSDSYSAWIDESGSNAAIDPGVYILSAAITEAEHVSDIRDTMRGLLTTRRHRRLHWRDEDACRQELIAKTIASLRVEHLVVVRAAAQTTDKPERRRRLCMERLLPELVSMGVAAVTIESRGRTDDQRDGTTLQNLRRKQQLSGPLHMDHVGGPIDPMLWIPDACCGAVTQRRCGNGSFYAHIESRVTLIEI